MQFNRIVLRNARIVTNASFNPGSGLNYFVGENGSGKTSLLEGINILSSGNSFRTHRVANLISHGQDSLQSFAEFSDGGDQSNHTLGVERSRNGNTRIKLDREPVSKLSILTQTIPLLTLHPESHLFVNGGPSLRRKLIDWGVFHVEPQFMKVWRGYKRALEQRNAALKQSAANDAVVVWDQRLVEYGEQLQQYRSHYLTSLLPYIDRLLTLSRLGCNVSIALKRGWGESTDLSEALNGSIKRDRQYRTTTVGPHRAELLFTDSDQEIKHVFSRGQQKLFVYLLRLAQANHIAEVKNQQSVFLCDDLPAELDINHRKIICEELTSSGYQVFATSVEKLADEFEAFGATVFHVEHGKVAQVI